jgi:hypothetical protein
MTTEEFLKQLKKGYDTNLEIAQRKNSDYAQDGDPFKNFKLCEQLGITSVEQGMLVRISDKLSRISNLLSRPNKVADEKIEDTLSDLCNYSMILKIWIEQKNK